RVAATFERTEGRPIRRTLLVGRWLDAYDALPNARAVGLQITRILDGDFRALVDGDVEWLAARLKGEAPDVVILDELLEAAGAPVASLDVLTRALPARTWYAVSYANAQSMPARVLR